MNSMDHNRERKARGGDAVYCRFHRRIKKTAKKDASRWLRRTTKHAMRNGNEHM